MSFIINNSYKNLYMLNVCGCDEIFYGDKHKIGAYKYIKKCLSENKKPHFHLISIDKIKSRLRAYPKETNFFYSLTQKAINTLDEHVKHIEEYGRHKSLKSGEVVEQLSWNSNEMFSVYLDNLVYLPKHKDCDKIFLKVAIYHGQELRQQLESDRICVDKAVGTSLKLNQNIVFGVRLKNLNRCAKLCISVHCISKRKRVYI